MLSMTCKCYIRLHTVFKKFFYNHLIIIIVFCASLLTFEMENPNSLSTVWFKFMSTLLITEEQSTYHKKLSNCTNLIMFGLGPCATDYIQHRPQMNTMQTAILTFLHKFCQSIFVAISLLLNPLLLWMEFSMEIPVHFPEKKVHNEECVSSLLLTVICTVFCQGSFATAHAHSLLGLSPQL